MALYGAVEIGGTKTEVAFGTSPEDMTTPVRITTTSPEETIGAVVEVLGDRDVDAVGVACFGPLDLRLGAITTTPKPGWSETEVLRTLKDALDVPVKLDLDVNGSALGEGTWGSAVGLDNFIYVTVGTGIGAAVVVNGELVSGSTHPEVGHMAVGRMPDDQYPGRCPFHRDCLEGMASGPALDDRFGPPESRPSEIALDVATHYLAQGMRNLIYVAAPEKVIVGGGVSRTSGFHDELRAKTAQLMGGYPRPLDMESLISPPGLGHLAGLAGALVLAGAAG